MGVRQQRFDAWEFRQGSAPLLLRWREGTAQGLGHPSQDVLLNLRPHSHQCLHMRQLCSLTIHPDRARVLDSIDMYGEKQSDLPKKIQRRVTNVQTQQNVQA